MTLTPSLVEVDSVAVVALMWHNTEVLATPVIVIWYVESCSLGCLKQIIYKIGIQDECAMVNKYLQFDIYVHNIN